MTTQEKIINVATQEFLNSGYLGASLRKIAKAAHVTTGAMYGYYKNKEALFNDIVEEVSEEFKNDYLVARRKACASAPAAPDAMKMCSLR